MSALGVFRRAPCKWQDKEPPQRAPLPGHLQAGALIKAGLKQSRLKWDPLFGSRRAYYQRASVNAAAFMRRVGNEAG